jgi:DNA polymerase-3 subunit epsilon
METVAVLDFETTGMSPRLGDRPTEIAVALVCDGRIVDRYQSLMNPQRRIPAEITALTGISNAMVAGAPPVAVVMREAARFVAQRPIVAHNAAFDQRFWDAELERLDIASAGAFACTLLLSRRLYPQFPNHKLSTVVRALALPVPGRAHRAMVDAEMTSHLWCRLLADVRGAFGAAAVSHALLARAQRSPRTHFPRILGTAGAA